jgi:hypothetical protein
VVALEAVVKGRVGQVVVRQKMTCWVGIGKQLPQKRSGVAQGSPQLHGSVSCTFAVCSSGESSLSYSQVDDRFHAEHFRGVENVVVGPLC